MRVVVALLLAAALPEVASAQEAEAEAPAEDAPPPSASPYVTAVREAMTALHGGDVDTAITALRTLTNDNPGEAAAFCHLGTALLRQNQVDPAIDSFRTCARVARQQADPLHEGRGLLNIARLLVIDRSKHTEARGAVSALAQFAETHGDVIAPELVGQMEAALTAIIALDAQAAEVRARREARAAAAD